MLTSHEQNQRLNRLLRENADLKPFRSRLPGGSLGMADMITMQVNVGKMCNQTCKHCHVDAGPTRKEIMTQETMRMCLNALDKFPFKIVDITGGAPEMNPHFRWFVEQVRARGRHVIDRCNLTIVESNERFRDLPDFFKRHEVEIVCSLPSFDSHITDRQRGDGVFGRSIQALKRLNAVGYGIDPNLKLNMVYNPNGAFLPGNQVELEAEFKSRLRAEYGIEFNSLYTITNMPISRFLEYLERSGNLLPYMRRLNQQFNGAAAQNVMCRSMISVGWDGKIYDCDFNQMLELEVHPKTHISQFDGEKLACRQIVLGEHCYGCTAGAGSSCGGSVT